eukprot:TRINITY_DN13585_c0_g1_i1.p1 TRINITY_DN13585_c0_g1~~TRINITY_DN13585_c0_g1_i1.p1  ORF type:complete len:685 (+),score=155.59 TRINITY_DN13585_c0_g1_i1:212-2266(+)
MLSPRPFARQRSGLSAEEPPAGMMRRRQSAEGVKRRRQNPRKRLLRCVTTYLRVHQAIRRMAQRTRLPLRPSELEQVKQLYNATPGLDNTKAIQNLLRELGQNVSDSELSRLLDGVLYSNGTHLSFERFSKIMEALKKRAFDAIVPDTVEAFAALGGSKDRTGVIDTERLRSEIGRFQLTIDIDAMIHDVDKDRSGKIEFEEFSAMFDGGKRKHNREAAAAAERANAGWPVPRRTDSITSFSGLLPGCEQRQQVLKPQQALNRKHILTSDTTAAQMLGEAVPGGLQDGGLPLATDSQDLATSQEDEVDARISTMSRLFDGLQREIDERLAASAKARKLGRSQPTGASGVAEPSGADASASGPGRQRWASARPQRREGWAGPRKTGSQSRNVTFIGNDRASAAGFGAQARAASLFQPGRRSPPRSAPVLGVHRGGSGHPRSSPPPAIVPDTRVRPASALAAVAANATPADRGTRSMSPTLVWPKGTAAQPAPRCRVAGAPRGVNSMRQQLRRAGPLSVRTDAEYSYCDYLAGTPSFVSAPRTYAEIKLHASDRARRIDASRHRVYDNGGEAGTLCAAARIALRGMRNEESAISPRVYAGAQDPLMAAASRCFSAEALSKGAAARSPSPGVVEKRRLQVPRPVSHRPASPPPTGAPDQVPAKPAERDEAATGLAHLAPHAEAEDGG